MTSSVVMLPRPVSADRAVSARIQGCGGARRGGASSPGASQIIRNVQYARRAAERVRSSRSGGLRGEYLQQRQVNRRLLPVRSPSVLFRPASLEQSNMCAHAPRTRNRPRNIRVPSRENDFIGAIVSRNTLWFRRRRPVQKMACPTRSPRPRCLRGARSAVRGPVRRRIDTVSSSAMIVHVRY